jgi:hypothetical protein
VLNTVEIAMNLQKKKSIAKTEVYIFAWKLIQVAFSRVSRRREARIQIPAGAGLQ